MSVFHRSLVAAALLIMASPAVALASSCKPALSNDGARSGNEAVAQNLAIARWEHKARRIYGAAYDNWGKAVSTRISCKETALTNVYGRPSYVCEIKGKPCRS